MPTREFNDGQATKYLARDDFKILAGWNRAWNDFVRLKMNIIHIGFSWGQALQGLGLCALSMPIHAPEASQ